MLTSEKQAQGLKFSKGIFSGLIFCAAYIWMFELLNVKIDKRISWPSYELPFLRVAFIAWITNLNLSGKIKNI